MTCVAHAELLPMPIEAADKRLEKAREWVAEQIGKAASRIEPISGDASFRRYFRVHGGGRTLVLMDAPPDREDSRPFIDVCERLRGAGLHAPEVLHFDLQLGFGLLEDLGDTLYRNVIDGRSALTIFPDLFDVLTTMASEVPAEGLPPYDEDPLQQELDLFTDWYLACHRGRALSPAETDCWKALCSALIESAKSQPQVFVHRDFHSCNLMWLDGKAPGIIDFQDAVRGPLSYDFISLVWDRYIHWPRSQLELWMADMHARLAPDFDLETWVRYCDLMGLQRNLKVVGIFARLNYRDGKQGYLDMIPMFYRYLLDTVPRYPELADFRAVLEDPACAP